MFSILNKLFNREWDVYGKVESCFLGVAKVKRPGLGTWPATRSQV